MMKIFLSPAQFIEALKNGFDLGSTGWIAIFSLEQEAFEKMLNESGLDPKPVLDKLHTKTRLSVTLVLREGMMKRLVSPRNVAAMLNCYLQKDFGKELYRADWVLFDSLPKDILPEDLATPLSELSIPLEIVA